MFRQIKKIKCRQYRDSSIILYLPFSYILRAVGKGKSYCVMSGGAGDEEGVTSQGGVNEVRVILGGVGFFDFDSDIAEIACEQHFY